MEEYLTFHAISAFFALTALEIVLGIDNLVFLAIIVGKLDKPLQNRARVIGLCLAMIFRVLLLLAIRWLTLLTGALFEIADHAVSARDIVLLLGGLFLLWKATFEMHDSIEGVKESSSVVPSRRSFFGALIQIVLIDLVFSLDSIITAVGLAEQVGVMIAAIVVAIGFMMFFSSAINTYIEAHPTLKVLALSFLLLVGVMLVADGCGVHISRGYLYFAMAFSLFVELLNIRMRKNMS